MQTLMIPGFFIFFFTGLSLLLNELFPVPSRAVKAAVLSYTKSKKRISFEEPARLLAKKLERYIWIGKYRRIKIQKTLLAAHMDTTPEKYIAEAAAPAILFAAVTIIPTIFFFAPAAIAFIILAVQMYLKSANKAGQEVKKKREEIALELPHFASTIAEELKKSRNITAILTSYRKVCGTQFQKELDITLADMRTGNHREALGRLSERVGDSGLLQICRGLQSVLDGSDQQLYFEYTSNKLENAQDQQTERHIQSLYNKIKPYSMMLLVCMIFTLLCLFGIYVFNNMNL